jgi:hypothetical protein
MRRSSRYVRPVSELVIVGAGGGAGAPGTGGVVMTVAERREVVGTMRPYSLVPADQKGNERQDTPDGRRSLMG